MIYVTSDLHGLELSKLQELLGKVNFLDNDWLYILGDVIDRQNDGGIEILRWLLEQPNVEIILGNHEAMLLSCDFVFEKITDTSLANLTKEQLDCLTNYIYNGGNVTLKALKDLKNSSPETVEYIIEYLREAPLYETVRVGERVFLLCHSGLDNFDKNKKLSEYKPHDFLWAWPEITDRYFDDCLTVFGHTPTMSYDKNMKGKIFKTDTWIDVDVGVPYGNNPCLLRLDDLEEFYL